MSRRPSPNSPALVAGQWMIMKSVTRDGSPSHSAEAGIRQLNRLTGIGKNIISKLNGKSSVYESPNT